MIDKFAKKTPFVIVQEAFPKPQPKAMINRLKESRCLSEAYRTYGIAYAGLDPFEAHGAVTQPRRVIICVRSIGG